jgi:NACalpha-BTF3-like transcription factor
MTDTNVVQRVTLNEQQLFDRLVKLFTDQLTLSEDIASLKADAKFHKDENPKGISKDDIKFVSQAAKLESKQLFEEFSGDNAAVIAKYKTLTGY